MFMYYCGQKDNKFGELKWFQTAAKVLRSRENHVENKNFYGGSMPPNGGACPQTPLPARSGSARAGHVFDMCRATTFGVT